jgi:hypothetical protein
MTREQCEYFLSQVLKATDADVNILIKDCLAEGWTIPHPVGPMLVSLARLPAPHGARSSNFQVTIR